MDVLRVVHLSQGGLGRTEFLHHLRIIPNPMALMLNEHIYDAPSQAGIRATYTLTPTMLGMNVE